MSEKPKPEPHPFEKFRELARKVVSRPKSEVEDQDRQWREGRQKSTPRPS